MEAEFWHNKWKTNVIGFHMSEANPVLVKYFDQMALEKGSRVFIPLCGKTLDIAWLLSQGVRVVGAELSEHAIKQLFYDLGDSLGLEPEVSVVGDLLRYSAEGIDVFVGDIFKLTKETLGKVDAIYDRAALVALPREVRSLYTAHLLTITGVAQQLLLSFTYDQSQLDGPPFSVTEDEVRGHYNDHYKLSLLDSINIKGGLKGKCDAIENVWLLKS